MTAQIIAAKLRALPGVAEVWVPAGALGAERLNIRIAATADAVGTAFQIGRLLHEEFGIATDEHNLQLIEESAEPTVAIELPYPALAPRPTEGRPALCQLRLTLDRLHASASVTLSYRGELSEGHGLGTMTDVGLWRAVALATLRSLQQLVAEKAHFELDEVAVRESGERAVVFVSLLMLDRERTERLAGVARVRDDVRQAVIRAILNSTNRRVSPLLP